MIDLEQADVYVAYNCYRGRCLSRRIAVRASAEKQQRSADGEEKTKSQTCDLHRFSQSRQRLTRDFRNPITLTAEWPKTRECRWQMAAPGRGLGSGAELRTSPALLPHSRCTFSR